MNHHRTIHSYVRTFTRRSVILVALASSILLTLFFMEGMPFVSYTDRGHAEEVTSDVTVELTERAFTWRGNVALESYEVTYCDGTVGSVQTGSWENGATLDTDGAIASVKAWGTGGAVSAVSRICADVASVASAPVCPPADLSVNGNTFSWTGCPHMERYTATFCDATSVGPVYGEWNDDVTIDLGKRIASVQACGSDCHKKVEQSCPPPTPEPVAPACPFVESASTTVVRFDQEKLYSNGSLDEAQSAPYSLSLSSGSYKVETASWDGYLSRTTVSQPRESWLVELRDGTGVVTTSNSTTDLADNVVESFIQETVNPSLVVDRPASSLVVRHAAYPENTSYNSVVPICAAFTKLPPSIPSGPSCSASVTPSSMKRGGQATLSWTSTGAVTASFDQGIGTTTLNGTLSVSPTNDTTYTGTFVDAAGSTTTCSARVSITSGGGGGKCLNCDDDEEEEEEEEERTPTFVLGKTISRSGTTITLDQIPYTGFEAGPVATAFFWFAVFMLSVGIGYLITTRRPLTRFAETIAVREYRTDTRNTPDMPIEQNDRIIDLSLYDAPVVTAVAPEKRSIEDRAHQDNILLSPESLRIINGVVANKSVDRDVFLKELFDKAIATYTREDGWILLSQERTRSLLESHAFESDARPSLSDRPEAATPVKRAIDQESGARPVSTHTVQGGDRMPDITARTIERFDLETTLPLFLDHLNAKEQQKGFELLRQLLTKGVPVETFITVLVRKLDDVYKHRLEGNHSPDHTVAAKTATWSNADFEAVLGILVECIDYSYSSNKVGTKVALTKLFARV